MPAPELSDRYQVAVLWPASGVDSYGQQTVGDPFEVRVRWNDKLSEKLDPRTNLLLLDATAIVDQDVAVGSRMWLGSLAEWNALADADKRVMEVKTFNSTPDVKNRYYQRTVGLMRYKNVTA